MHERSRVALHDSWPGKEEEEEEEGEVGMKKG